MISKLSKLLMVFLISISSAHATPTPQTLRVVVGYPPGGAVDVAARQFVPFLSKELGQPIIVENKPGLTGLIGAAEVSKASSSTPVLYFAASPTITITPNILKTLPVDPRKELTAVAPLLTFTNVLLVNKDVPFNNVKELITFAKANPGKITYGSSGIGATNHLSGELIEQKTGVKMTHVPYKGNALAMNDVMGGQITMMFDITGTAYNFITTGKVKPLAVTSRTRHASLPNVPTMIEAGIPDFEVGGWFAIFGPMNMSADQVEKYNSAIRAVLANREYRTRLTEGGYDGWSGSAKDLGNKVSKDSNFWHSVVKDLKFE
jgi:tripartite-type tricarboxylate transporter receptor subunit TctC